MGNSRPGKKGKKKGRKGGKGQSPSTSSSSTGKSWKRCLDSHPPLPLKDGMVIYGGSCSDPRVSDADVYIGFDHGMRFTWRHFPWKKGYEVQYRITDMSAPKEIESFRKLIDWTIKQLQAGEKIHAGCIGGHGRTGLFFAALVKELGITDDAITYVREHYCKKVVETESQIDFLFKHFGITKVKPSKKPLPPISSKGKAYFYDRIDGDDSLDRWRYSTGLHKPWGGHAGTGSGFTVSDNDLVVEPTYVDTNVWGFSLGEEDL